MPKSSDQASIELWKAQRQRCRVNLGYLCTEGLGYMDVSKVVHGEMINHLQKFRGGIDGAIEDVVKGKGYTPACSMWELEGPRRRMILIPRGHLKTSIVTAAHSIQWIINYPNVRILISTGTGDQMGKFLTEIKQHFQFNPRFRGIFPEFCPPAKNVKDWGTQEQFTVPCRTYGPDDRVLREPTVSTCSVDKVTAGGHFDVIKHDDLQDEIGARTPGRIDTIKRHFGEMGPLLETHRLPPHHGWEDITGTIYDYSDLHYSIYEAEMAKPPEKRAYSILMRSAAPNYPEGPVMWPERMPLAALKAIEDDPVRGPAVLYPQYLMNPIVGKSGLVDSDKDLVWVPAEEMSLLVDRLSRSLHLTVDLAGMETDAKGRDNDYTAMTLHGFTGGVMYVPMIWHGRYSPEEVINILFQVAKDYPWLSSIKMEKEAHSRVLLPFLRREMARRSKWLPIDVIKRDNRTSKQQRIRSLQPWLKQKAIRFAANLPCRLHLINEILRFPKYSHDDILDTLADAMQNRDGTGANPDVAPAAFDIERFNTLGVIRPDGTRTDIPARNMLERELFGKEDEDAGVNTTHTY